MSRKHHGSGVKFLIPVVVLPRSSVIPLFGCVAVHLGILSPSCRTFLCYSFQYSPRRDDFVFHIPMLGITGFRGHPFPPPPICFLHRGYWSLPTLARTPAKSTHSHACRESDMTQG